MKSLLEAISPTGEKLLAIRNSPAMLTVMGRFEKCLSNAGYRVTVSGQSVDENLGGLVSVAGDIGRSVPSNHQCYLIRLGVITVAWLEIFGLAFEEILADVAQERLRQRRLFQEGKFIFRVDSPYVEPLRKLRVLTEEIGEVAEAIDDLEAHPKSLKCRHHLITELTQVAAVTVAWLESLEPA